MITIRTSVARQLTHAAPKTGSWQIPAVHHPPTMSSQVTTASSSCRVSFSAQPRFSDSHQSFIPLYRPTHLQKKTMKTDNALIEVAHIAENSGVRLTNQEIRVLRKKLASSYLNGSVTVEELNGMRSEAMYQLWARETSLSAIEQPTSWLDRVGSRLITLLDHGGKALFAVVGTQLAGEAGMNIVGCTLVGCISCLGGGTLNNLLYGTPALLDRPGVNWVRVPDTLYLAIAASVITFFAWPLYCRAEAKEYLEQVFAKDNLLDSNGHISREAFCYACYHNEVFRADVARAVLPDDVKALDANELFDLVDTDQSGYVDLEEMEQLVHKEFIRSPIVYVLDTIALSALSVAGVHGAIGRGLSPLIACTSGITICFGGILRDVLCGRDLALGGLSYGMVTTAGSTVYVLLRELSLRAPRNIPTIPLVARILLSVSATAGVRAYEWYLGEPLLKPMHYHRSEYRQRVGELNTN